MEKFDTLTLFYYYYYYYYYFFPHIVPPRVTWIASDTIMLLLKREFVVCRTRSSIRKDCYKTVTW